MKMLHISKDTKDLSSVFSVTTSGESLECDRLMTRVIKPDVLLFFYSSCILEYL